MGVINKVYKYISPNHECGYIFSEQRSGDPIGYDYFIITIRDGVPNITRIPNAIQKLQEENYQLYPFTEGAKDYEAFLKIKDLAEKRQKPQFKFQKTLGVKPIPPDYNNPQRRKRT